MTFHPQTLALDPKWFKSPGNCDEPAKSTKVLSYGETLMLASALIQTKFNFSSFFSRCNRGEGRGPSQVADLAS